MLLQTLKHTDRAEGDSLTVVQAPRPHHNARCPTMLTPFFIESGTEGSSWSVNRAKSSRSTCSGASSIISASSSSDFLASATGDRCSSQTQRTGRKRIQPGPHSKKWLPASWRPSTEASRVWNRPLSSPKSRPTPDVEHQALPRQA